MKIVVLGIRGIPNVQGGVETHAEHLYTRLAALGCEIEALVRSPFVPREQESFGSIRLRRIWSPTSSGLEAFVHSFLGVLYAGLVRRPDILHIHAIGPAIVAPVARLFGLKVVVTHHGPDYDRDKWGRFAKWVLRMGERSGVRYSHSCIAISKVISDLIKSKYGRRCELIPNGVVPAREVTGAEHLQQFGLQPGRYFLQVSRLVPEKRQLDLIRAFAEARPAGWKLALVGGVTSDSYCEEVNTLAAEVGDVVLTDFQTGAALAQLYTYAGAFVLPSSHEGLPIALLEALSYGLTVIASDIPANLEVGLESSSYFPLGDVPALCSRLKFSAGTEVLQEQREQRKEWVLQKYSWSEVARLTLASYKKALAA